MGKREKEKSKRSKQKYPNLNPKYNLKLRRDYINTHYVNGVKSVTGKGEGIRGLNDEEKEWLNKFYGEYVNASVNHDDYDSQLHDSEELVRDCYSRNNARNRCLLNKGKATNEVEFRSWEEFDQNTIAQLEDHDLELLNAYYAGLLDDENESEDS